MASPSWQISGQYCETCNCDYVCPCAPGGLAVKPSKGDCKFAMAFRIEKGTFGDVALNDLSFIVLGQTPGEMIKGSWTVGVLVDERATTAQRDAIAAICSGQAGGPMVGLAGLISNFAGVETTPITIDKKGLSWSVSAAKKVDMALDGVIGIGGGTEPIYLDNTGHPANTRFALARASRSHVHALGIDWDDVSGTNNAQFAPFSWKSA
jgi:hypothetical protein